MNYKDYLKDLHVCPFCQPEGRIIAENELAYITYAKAPYNIDHLLIVPKRHFEELLDLQKEEVEAIDALLRTSFELLKKLGHENISVLLRQGNASGKSIKHLHYHAIPDVVLSATAKVNDERPVLSEEEVQAQVKRVRMCL